MRRLLPLLVLPLLAAGAWWWLRPAAAAPERFAVRRGDLVEVLHEGGQVVARDPLVVAMPFDGHLDWVLDDATWVEAGAPLFTVGAEDELARAGEDRIQLDAARRELALARRRREAGGRTEDERVRAADAEAALARLRHRIATGTPRGGGELERLDRAVAVLEAAADAARAAAAPAEAAWDAAAAAWDAAADREQERRGASASAGAVLRAREAELDEAAARDPASLAGERAALARARAEERAAAAEARRARAALDAAAPARAAALAAVAAAEQALHGPLAELAIERRGAEAEALRHEVAAQAIAAAEAARLRREGEAQLAAGILSRLAVDDLAAAEAQTTAELAILRRRLAAAERPPGDEERADAEAALAAAEERAARAAGARTRALALLDRQIALAEAKVARLEETLAQRGGRFPEVVEAAIAAVQAELAEADEPARRGALEGRLAALRRDLAAAQAQPPNEVRAPIAGLARVRRDWGRPRLAGDQLWNGDAVVEILPPGNLAVAVRVNEAVVARIRPGQAVHLEVPAAGLRRRGRIAHVSGVGRDKAELQGLGGWSGVTQFEVRVALDPGPGEEDARLRQGMSVRVDIEAERLASALWLPLAAVGPQGAVRRLDGGQARVQGRRFGDDAFVIESGLAEGDAVRPWEDRP